MLVLPAIDLLDGNVVRLKKGNMAVPTHYGHDPIEVAKMFADMGAKRLHLVDLNGARTGSSQNYKVIESIAKNIDIHIEVGGGIRNMAILDSFIDAGADFAILGTVCVKAPEFVKDALRKYPNRIVLGIDAKDHKVVTDGWYDTSEFSVYDIMDRYKDFSVESVIYTDVEKDGMLQGVSIDKIKRVLEKSPFDVIASGGVSNISDIKDLRALCNPKLKGCIVGSAIYEGKLNLEEAFPAE